MVAHYLMIGHTLMPISSAQGTWAKTTLRTWGYGQKGSDPLRRISLYPGSTLGESSLPSTTYRQMILSAALKGWGCGEMNHFSPPDVAGFTVPPPSSVGQLPHPRISRSRLHRGSKHNHPLSRAASQGSGRPSRRTPASASWDSPPAGAR